MKWLMLISVNFVNKQLPAQLW